MKLLMVTALGLGLVYLGKKLLGDRMTKPLQALPSSERSHSEDQVAQVSTPAPIH